MKWKYLYHGWLIELIPLSQGYVFKCWMLDEQIGISNYHVYPQICDAIRAAKTRAQLESTSLSLTRFLDTSYENHYLSSQEHLALVSSISNFTISASKPKI
ncbi:hypothetical protein [Halotia branconii]|uniref:Uncharacterized protein n=1 Tax=Halotia branconii CENA392 TaxID=1539056 RepID=A0AAJ6NRW1_9CYAN|nr:hypothetical protein [Halotia branconii]WGV25588.1 hypothetical protein QI031_28320 [Halotia branconii CENA392]